MSFQTWIAVGPVKLSVDSGGKIEKFADGEAPFVTAWRDWLVALYFVISETRRCRRARSSQ